MTCRALLKASHPDSNPSPVEDQSGTEYHPVAFVLRARYLHCNNNDRSDPEGLQSGEALLVPQATATLCVAVRDGAYGLGRAPDATERVAMKNLAGCGMPAPPVPCRSRPRSLLSFSMSPLPLDFQGSADDTRS
jgi:hypothetical protein